MKQSWWEKYGPYLLAMALGLLAGYVDFHSEEVQPAALLLLVFSFGVGFVYPVRAWRWGVLMGVCIPLAITIGYALGFKPVYPAHPLSAFIAVIPALIGAYCGVGLRRGIEAAWKPDPHDG